MRVNKRKALRTWSLHLKLQQLNVFSAAAFLADCFEIVCWSRNWKKYIARMRLDVRIGHFFLFCFSSVPYWSAFASFVRDINFYTSFFFSIILVSYCKLSMIYSAYYSSCMNKGYKKNKTEFSFTEKKRL